MLYRSLWSFTPLSSHRQITKSEGPVTGLSNNETGYCSASARGVIQNRLHSAVVPSSLSLLLRYQLMPWPKMGSLHQREVCKWILCDSVWRAQEERWYAQRHGSGEACPPPAILFLFDGISVSRPTLNSAFSWSLLSGCGTGSGSAVPTLFLHGGQTAKCCVCVLGTRSFPESCLWLVLALVQILKPGNLNR